MSESETPDKALASQHSKGSKRRKVVTPPLSPAHSKETVLTADGKKQHSSPRLQSTTREYVSASAKKYVPNLHESATLWDADTIKARKVAVEIAKACASHADQSCYDQVEDFKEMGENLMLHAVQMAVSVEFLHKKHLQEVALGAESRAKISKLTQDLEEAKSEAKLGKINLEIAERLVEQAKQEKYIVELKSTGEKACLKRKIQELETELEQQKDRFKDVLLDAEVGGYNKCVKKAKDKGLRYKKHLRDPVYDPTEKQQEESVVHPVTDNSTSPDALSDMGNASDPTMAIPTVSSKAKALLDDPIFYRSMIEVLAKKTVKGDSGTLKPKSDPSKLTGLKKAVFILGYNKCIEFVGKDTFFDPSKHSFKAFLASEMARLGIPAPGSGNNEH